jgi:hypothetical protein
VSRVIPQGRISGTSIVIPRGRSVAETDPRLTSGPIRDRNRMDLCRPRASEAFTLYAPPASRQRHLSAHLRSDATLSRDAHAILPEYKGTAHARVAEPHRNRNLDAHPLSGSHPGKTGRNRCYPERRGDERISRSVPTTQ